MRSTLLLLLLLATPLASAATDPGARALIADDATTAGLMAPASGNLILGTRDSGSNNIVTGDNPTEEVWFVMDPLGTSDLETGNVDIAACSEQSRAIGSGDDCKTAVALMATNDAGTRHAFTGLSESGLVLLLHPNDGTPNRIVIPNAIDVLLLDIDASGSAVAVAYQTGVNQYAIMAYRWEGDDVTPWDDPVALTSAPTGLSVAGDGFHFAVTAGETYYQFRINDGTGAYKDNQFPGTGRSVAMAADAKHTTVMGSSLGRLVFHDDETAANDQKLNFKRAESPITTIAITDDASILAWSNAAGTFGMGSYKNDVFQVLAEFALGAEPDAIALDAAGETAAVVIGKDVYLFGREENTVLQLWKNTPLPAATGQSNLGTVSISADGETVLVPRTDGLLVYDAIHNLDVTGNTPTLTPGVEGTLTLRFANTGNRLAATDITPVAPAGWTVVPSQDAVVVAPDKTVEIPVLVTPAANAEPGTTPIEFITNINGTAVTHSVDIKLDRVVDWAIGMREDAAQILSMNAGTPGTFQMYVENLGNTKRPAPLRLSVSNAAWEAEFTSGDGDIAAGAKENLDVKVTPPANALELEEATITVRLDGFGDPVVLRAVVGAVFDIKLDAPGGLEAEAGKATTFNVTVKNDGNTADGATIAFGDLPAGWEGRFEFGLTEATVRDIPAHGSKRVEVTIDIPLGETLNTPFLVFLEASSFGDPQNEVEKQVLITVVEAKVDKPDGEDSPGLPLVGLLAALGVAAVVRRRK